MISAGEVKKSLVVSLWFVFLTFPIMVMRVDPVESTVHCGVGINVVYVIDRQLFALHHIQIPALTEKRDSNQ
jgi:hypothetical protein